MAEGGSYKRRQYLVNRPLQFRFVRAMLAIVVATSGASMLATYAAVRFTLVAYDLGHEELFVALLGTTFWIFVLELLAITAIVVWVGIRLTHKIAGPLVRIHATLVRMAEGQFDVQLRLRDGDELTEIADDINRLAAYLRERSK